MGCLDKADGVRYLAGDLSYEDHQAAERHLDSCSTCTAMLSELTGRPEQRAQMGGGFQSAVTERLPIETDNREKVMWLERHYGLQIGDVVDGKYRIERVLGEGGMGIVLLATHILLRDQVALKFMHPSMVANAGHAARFIREARAAVSLRNENVARVLDFGEIPDIGPFIVMEYLEGQDLLAYLNENAPLPVNECIDLIAQAASGVAAAHAAGIIHRDLKPGNMFITKRHDGSRVLKVLDFGVSKYIEGDSLSMTKTNMVVGSPMYMAPEMFESARNASFGSDIWALGVIFYRMLSGRLPFYAESLPEMVAKIHFSKPTPLSHWRPRLPVELGQIIGACLARHPSERFGTALEFQNAIAQLNSVGEAPVGSLPLGQRTFAPDRSGVGDAPDPVHPIALASAGGERRSPWIFALVGAAVSAAGFAVIMAASGGDGSRDRDPAAATPAAVPEATGAAKAISTPPGAGSGTQTPSSAAALTAPAAPASMAIDAGSASSDEASADEVTEVAESDDEPESTASTSKATRRTARSTRRRRKPSTKGSKASKPAEVKPPPKRPEDDLLLP